MKGSTVNGALESVGTNSKTQDIRALIRQPSPEVSRPAHSAVIQQTSGNLAIQRRINSEPVDVDESSISQPVVLPNGPDPQQAPTPQVRKDKERRPRIDEDESMKRAAEATGGRELPEATDSAEEAAASPEEDPAHKAVVGQLQVKAKNQETPLKKAEQKQQETILAANLTSVEVHDENAKKKHLKKMKEVVEKAQPHELTVEEFMGEFKDTTKQVAAKLPQNQDKLESETSGVEVAVGKASAKQSVANLKRTQSLRAATKDSPADRDNEPEQTKPYQLERDPAGNVPTIKNAKTAAPKPKTEKAISLDDQSRALDDALVNHNVGGTTINIDEGSLAFPVSGEKTFDEAGEFKRKAQDEIRKAKPKYREEEGGVINKSQADIQSFVNSGLKFHNQSRSNKFGDVFGVQKRHEGNIVHKKRSALSELQGIYNETKNKVDKELDELKNPSIEDVFEKILNNAEEDFKKSVRERLEYIYTPGHWGFDYSDWIPDHKTEINQEYNRLMGENFKAFDTKIQELSKDSKVLATIAGGLHSVAGDVSNMQLYLQALKNVQDIYANKAFETAKQGFIHLVTYDVREQIATRVVKSLNAAKNHIEDGNRRVEEAYGRLTPDEKLEADGVLKGVQAQFQALQESVDERHHELVADMARTYNKSVGKLKATFDEIKKDVLTSWLEKAWNKIKAVVNAIIEFATRIAELLGRVLYLLGDILSSPRAFFSNLITGIGEGFSTFAERIDEFLATAFFDWIRGTSGVQVQLPKEWNPAGIFSLFTQLLNLSTETIWQRMEVVYDKSVANAFRQGEFVLEKGLEIFDIVKREGLGGLWDHIVESLGTLLSDTLDMIKETVLYAAIKKVMIEIGKMLIPGGGFIAIAEKIIRLLVFIVEARNKILDLIEAFVTSMENAVKGDIAGIVKLVTTALTRFITLALDFLVSFFGLSSLKEKVERFIERMRNPVIRGIDFVLLKFKPLVMKGKELVAKGTEKAVGAGKAVVAKVANWLGIRKRFTSEGETHTLFFKGNEASAQLWVATEEMPFSTLLKSKQIEINAITDEPTKARKLKALTSATAIYDNDIVRLKNALAGAIDEPSKTQLQSDLNDKFNEIVPHLVTIGVGSGGRLPKTLVRVGSPNGRADWVEADPVTKHDSKRPERVTVEPLGWASHIKTIANFDEIYVRLHLLHFSLGGPGNDTGNVTPGRKSENINMYKQGEEKAVDLVHEKGKVLWYKANVTGYRSEAGYTDFAEGIRVRYGFKEKKEDGGEWVKIGDVLYDSVFPVTKPDPKGTSDPVPTINTLTFDYWDDVLKKVPNPPARDVYRKLIAAKNRRGGYGDWPEFIGSKEFKDADTDYDGSLEDWFKSAITQSKIRSI